MITPGIEEPIAPRRMPEAGRERLECGLMCIIFGDARQRIRVLSSPLSLHLSTMPRVPTLSPATGKTVPAHYIHTTAGQFVDTAGRTVIFRGVNLSGSSKAPVGQQSQVIEGFWEKAEAGGESFVNQPLNLDDGTADVHLARLRGWGFNFLRFPVTWEALEHAGPRKYDYEFMDYVVRVLRKCKEFGFKVFMDPHQDVVSNCRVVFVSGADTASSGRGLQAGLARLYGLFTRAVSIPRT